MSLAQKTVTRIGAVLKDPLLILKVGPSEKLSRRVFGNTAGLVQNIIGKTAVYSRRVYPNIINTKTQDSDLVQHMHDHGYAKMTGAYDGQDFELLRAKIVKALDEAEKTAPENQKYKIYLRDLHTQMPELFDLVNDRIMQYGRAYFGSQVVIADMIPYRTKYVPQKVINATEGDIYSDRWHCDSCRSSILTFMLLLNDVDEDGGPFHFLSKQDTKTIVNSDVYNLRNDSRQLENYLQDKAPEMVNKLTGKAGDILFFNTSEGLHRADLIRKRGRNRDMVRIDLRPTFGKYPKNHLYIVKG